MRTLAAFDEVAETRFHPADLAEVIDLGADSLHYDYRLGCWEIRVLYEHARSDTMLAIVAHFCAMLEIEYQAPGTTERSDDGYYFMRFYIQL